jgi:hypothetical protein
MNQTCEPTGIAACAVGTPIRCADRTNCSASEVCCGQLDNATGYKSVSCEKSCASSGFTTAVRFCNPNNPVDECGDIGRTCQPSSRLAGYSVCQ